MNHLTALTLTISALVPMLGAQGPTYRWSPRGADKYVGGNSNTIPFWGVSDSYQQIHDASDFGGAPVPMKGMALRPKGAQTLTGRTWELRLTLSQTKVDANSMSTTFSTNLTGTNTAAVFGTATTFSKFSWPTTTSSGSATTVNPPAFTVPFANSYLYVPSLGNLCWEWRHRSASDASNIQMDLAFATDHRGKVLANVGKGCLAGTNSTPATATITNSKVGSGGYLFQSTLSNATSSQAAILALGVTPSSQNLGWCTNVELLPLLYLYGMTDSSGKWLFQAPIKSAAGASALTIYLQYAYNDSGQAAGFGLSDMAGYTAPNLPGANGVSRLWSKNSKSTTNGKELDTTGTVGLGSGFIVGWLQ